MIVHSKKEKMNVNFLNIFRSRFVCMGRWWP